MELLVGLQYKGVVLNVVFEDTPPPKTVHPTPVHQEVAAIKFVAWIPCQS